MRSTLALLLILSAAPVAAASPAPAAAASPAPASDPSLGTANASSALVQRFLDLRAPGHRDALNALLTQQSPPGQKMLAADLLIPPDVMRKDALQQFFSSARPANIPVVTPEDMAFIAMVLDLDNSLGFKFRVLGPSATNPYIVRMQAHETGTPPGDLIPFSIVTAPDPTAGNALRINTFGTMVRYARRISSINEPVHFSKPYIKPNDAEPARSPQTMQPVPDVQSLINLKQIGLGLMMYTQDCDLPPFMLTKR